VDVFESLASIRFAVQHFCSFFPLKENRLCSLSINEINFTETLLGVKPVLRMVTTSFCFCFTAMLWSSLWPDRGCPLRDFGHYIRRQGVKMQNHRAVLRVFLSWVLWSKRSITKQKMGTSC